MTDMIEPKKKFPWRSLVAFEAVTLGLGGIVGFLTQRDSAFYAGLAKPSFAPPGWVFPVAWTLLYASMALSAWYMWHAKGPDRRILLGLYAAQLVVNLVWPWLFFTRQALGLAFFWLILLWMLAAIMLYRFFQEKKISGWLLVPYQFWLTFAAALNYAIASMN